MGARTRRAIGQFIRLFRNDDSSAEHNLDVARAFSMAYEIKGVEQWRLDAEHAEAFVYAMEDTATGCFLTGTTDPDNRNDAAGQLPLDVQAWFVLVFPDAAPDDHIDALACGEANHRTLADGFDLYDFNEDRDGVWFEGAAQMSLAYAVAGQIGEAGRIKPTVPKPRFAR